MAYFSNGEEGMNYEDEWCSKCCHYSEGNCPILEIHFSFNYDQCSDKKIASILSSLIPREGIGNAKCNMFKEK